MITLLIFNNNDIDPLEFWNYKDYQIITDSRRFHPIFIKDEDYGIL